MVENRYPQPSPAGGKLIREVISFIRANKIQLPLSSQILIATSGGSDSIALAHLLIKYGRRVVVKNGITLLHVNHGWRGKESEKDAVFVQKMAKKWGVRCIRKDLPAQSLNDKDISLEEAGRLARKKIFAEILKRRKKPTLILTAHQADDLAETLLWRLFTGAAQTHGGGILFREGEELRPLLRVRKKTLQNYLHAEGVPWREDKTNGEGRFLRSKMRLELLPVIEKLFPRSVEHLVKAALRAQQPGIEKGDRLMTVPGFSPLSQLLFAASALKTRRIHWEFLKKHPASFSPRGEIHLPEGWRLRWEKGPQKQRFVLEKHGP